MELHECNEAYYHYEVVRLKRELAALKLKISESPIAEISRGEESDSEFLFLQRITGRLSQNWFVGAQQIILARWLLPNLSDLEPGQSAQVALVRRGGRK